MEDFNVENNGELAGKVALITGSSRGIGRACVLRFVRAGPRVVINYLHHEEEADSTLQAAEAIAPGSAIKIRADVSCEDDVKAMFKTIHASLGRVDILVNNAGIHKDNLLLRMKTADFDQVIDVNLKSVYLCCKLAVKDMLRQKGGRIVNIASVVAQTGNAGQTNYAASKAGVLGLTKSLAQEMASRQIAVNAVAPGFIDSEMTQHFDAEHKENTLKKIPYGRFGTCEEVAEVVLFLSSDRSPYMTGQTLNVDGGMVML